MNNAEYQDLPGISSHWLIEMLNNPAACWRKYLDPQRATPMQTDALRIGSLVHGLALTPRQFDREFIVADGDRRSIAGRRRYAELEATGLMVVRRTELEKARAIVAALHDDPAARRLLRGGKKERTIIQPRARGLLPLKARLDVHHEARREVLELKTIRDLFLVDTSIRRYRYPLSAAFYRAMVRGLRTTFLFVQTREPFRVSIFEMSQADLQEGEMMWRTALEMFDTCWKLKQWPEMDGKDQEDDDPLMLPAVSAPRCTGPRFDVPVGELAL